MIHLFKLTWLNGQQCHVFVEPVITTAACGAMTIVVAIPTAIVINGVDGDVVPLSWMSDEYEVGYNDQVLPAGELRFDFVSGLFLKWFLRCVVEVLN